MKLTRRKLLAGAAASAIFPKGADAWTHGTLQGAPGPTYLSNLAGPAAGTLNMLPWSAYATHTDFTLAADTFAGFNKTRSSISATNITAPDTTATGQHLAEDSSTNTHLVKCNNCPASVSLSFIPIRVAVIAKAAERTRMVVEWVENNHDPTGTDVTIGFDLSGGNTNYDNSVGTNQTLIGIPSMTSLGNGWWFCRFDVVHNVFVESGGGTLWSPAIYLDAGSGTGTRNISYAGNGTSGVDLWWFSVMPRQAWNITHQTFYDDFNSLSTIDLGNTQAPGFNWYLNGPSPDAVPQDFWNFVGYPTANPAYFSISSPSVLKMYNPNDNQTGFTTILDTIRADSSHGFVGTQFQAPLMADCSVSLDNTGPVATSLSIWHPSVESRTNNGLSATFQFKEFNTFEIGHDTVATGEQLTWVNTANTELPNKYSMDNGNTGGILTVGNFHRISGIWITRDQNGYGWGCCCGFLDGQMGGGQNGIGTYNGAAASNPFITDTTPGIGAQEDWHHGSIQMATGENTTGNPSGFTFPLYVDWVKIYVNPSPTPARPTWSYFDQPGTGSSPFVGALVLTGDGLTITKSSADAAWDMIRCGMGKGFGQWYWEVTLTGTVATSTSLMLGIADATQTVITSGMFPGSAANGVGARNGSNWNAFATGVTTPFSGTVGFVANDVFGFAFDADLGKVYIHRNGTWINGTPASGNAVWTGLTTTNPGVNAAGWYPAIAIHDTTCTATANFGQAAFAFPVPSGYNAGLTLASTVSAYAGPGDVLGVGAFTGYWGLRAFSFAKTGTKAVQLRRSTDSTTMDFVTLSNGKLDAASIATFAGAGTLKVAKFYDQTGNGNDAVPYNSTFEQAFTPNTLNSMGVYDNTAANATNYNFPISSTVANTYSHSFFAVHKTTVTPPGTGHFQVLVALGEDEIAMLAGDGDPGDGETAAIKNEGVDRGDDFLNVAAAFGQWHAIAGVINQTTPHNSGIQSSFLNVDNVGLGTYDLAGLDVANTDNIIAILGDDRGSPGTPGNQLIGYAAELAWFANAPPASPWTQAQGAALVANAKAFWGI